MVRATSYSLSYHTVTHFYFNTFRISFETYGEHNVYIKLYVCVDAVGVRWRPVYAAHDYPIFIVVKGKLYHSFYKHWFFSWLKKYIKLSTCIYMYNLYTCCFIVYIFCCISLVKSFRVFQRTMERTSRISFLTKEPVLLLSQELAAVTEGRTQLMNTYRQYQEAVRTLQKQLADKRGEHVILLCI